MKDSQKDFVLKVTGTSSIPYVMAGVASDSEGHVISENGLIALVELAEQAESNQLQVASLNQNLTDLQAKFDALQTKVSENETALASANQTIAEQKQTIDTLKKVDAGSPTVVTAAADPNNGGTEQNFIMSADVELQQLLKANS